MGKLTPHLKKLREQLKTQPIKCNPNCFECCTKIYFTKEEGKRMSIALRKSLYTKPPSEKGRDYCEYLDKDGNCCVYDERPIVCRAFGRLRTPSMVCSHSTDEERKGLPDPSKEFWLHWSGNLRSNLNGDKFDKSLHKVPVDKKTTDELVAEASMIMQIAVKKGITDEQAIEALQIIEDELVKRKKSLKEFFPKVFE